MDQRLSRLCAAQQLKALLRDLQGKRVVILGLGVFGGGEGAARFMADRGARVLVTDLKSATELAPVIERLDGLGIEYRLGSHLTEDVTSADLVVVNPAVPRSAQILKEAVDAGVPLTSPMNIFLTLCPAPIAAVTGSTGKSTTTAMLAGMLRAAGRTVHLGGNIGVSLLPVLPRISRDDLVALEISCFQLEDAAALPWSAHVAIITNLTPNHLDRYGNPHAYAAAKKAIIACQSPDDAAVLNVCDPILRDWAETEARGHVLLFDPESKDGPLVRGTNLRGGRVVWRNCSSEQVICTRSALRLPGKHNAANALAACAAARWLGAGAEDISQALAHFRGLEHRLEECGRFGGMTFYNDSDATTPESTVAGLSSFDGPVTVIAGGHNKDLSLTGMAEAIATHAEALVTMGACGPQIAQLTRASGARLGSSPIIREAGSLAEAVRAAVDLSMPGSSILFSPGCASFDMFQNFAQRGRLFKEYVRQASDSFPRSDRPDRAVVAS